MKIAEIYLNQKNKRIDKSYDYLIPNELADQLENGMRVVVNFGRGNRELEGFVVSIRQTTSLERKLKAIIYLIDAEAVLNKKQITFCLWMKNYYCNLFYENLAYFLGPIPIIKERLIKPGIKKITAPDVTLFQAYFPDNKAINYQKIKKDDRFVINQMIESGRLIEKKSYRVYQPSEEKIYYLKDQLLNKEQRLGSIQVKIISLLQSRALKESTLKQLIPQFKKSIPALIEKGLIGEAILSDFRKPQQLTCPKQTIQREIILSEQETAMYKKYQKHRQQGCFFLCNDRVAKYRVLFKLIDDQIKSGKSVLMLFPDINLSYQRLELFVKYFGHTLEFYHHHLKGSEQRNIYQAVKSNQAKLIIGVQGALFLPFNNLGLIIVDDEHSQSYHAMGSPKFHIPDLVENYCGLLKIPYLLMDEIPSIKTFHEVSTEKIGFLEVGKLKPIQNIDIVDMQKEMRMGNFKMISHALRDGIETNLKAQKLSVLLINRTGYSNAILCRACGEVLKCPNCKIALKYDSQANTLNCHYCDHRKELSENCPHCGEKQLRHLGMGIDQFQKLLSDYFPAARIISVQGGLSLKEITQINEALKNNQIDILIGTQVLNKHFSFYHIGLAASLLIDRDLNLGEFDSSEVTYQIYTRFFKKALKPGVKGLIQTSEPQNDTLLSIVENDFKAYYRDEITFREILKYPPFYNLIEFKILHLNDEWASNDALRLYLLIRDYVKEQKENFYLYKPNNQGFNQAKKWVVQIILKCHELKPFQEMMAYLIRNGDLEKIKSNISFKIKK